MVFKLRDDNANQEEKERLWAIVGGRQMLDRETSVKVMAEELKHRGIKNIVDSMMQLITSEQVSGQFAMDLEDLCAFAYKHMTNFDKLNGDPLPEEKAKELKEILEREHERFMKDWKKRHPGLRPLSEPHFKPLKND